MWWECRQTADFSVSVLMHSNISRMDPETVRRGRTEALAMLHFCVQVAEYPERLEAIPEEAEVTRLEPPTILQDLQPPPQGALLRAIAPPSPAPVTPSPAFVRRV